MPILLNGAKVHLCSAPAKGSPASRRFGDAQILENIANVAWSVFTSYVNSVAKTEIDFEPVVRHRAA